MWGGVRGKHVRREVGTQGERYRKIGICSLSGLRFWRGLRL
jgi:hypothetical protein